MAQFEDAIDTVLEHEGGFVNNRNDPGGITNWGVSLRFALASLTQDANNDGWMDGDIDHDGDIDGDDIRKMTKSDAIEIYRNYFWKKIFEDIQSQEIATKLFDMSVNMGHGQATKIIQRSIVDILGNVLVVDGGYGPNSLKYTNITIDKIGSTAFLDKIREEAWNFYCNLINKKPSLGVFAKGWKNRAFS